MKLIAVRHGETLWNVEGREMGHLDSPLTTIGVQQAHALAIRLSRIPFETIYSSDLGRAVQTAEIVAGACRKPLVLRHALRERHMGIFQGLTAREIESRYPRERREYEKGGADYVISGGESARQRLERSIAALTEIAATHANTAAVVVTHSGFLMGFFEYVLGLEPGNGWRFKRHNGSYSAFDFSGGKWSLETWNDISHLLEASAASPIWQGALDE